MADDSRLPRREARQQAQDAFAELVRRHLDFVCVAALRWTAGRSDVAADVAQQPFVALAIEHNAVLCSTDTDFARFPDLKWRNPLG